MGSQISEMTNLCRGVASRPVLGQDASLKISMTMDTNIDRKLPFAWLASTQPAFAAKGKCSILRETDFCYIRKTEFEGFFLFTLEPQSGLNIRLCP